MDITIETITPAKAAEYLAHNEGNRRVNKQRVELYKREMLAGHWRMTGDPIRFNGTRLLDGQHRLAACVEADCPFTTAVVRGIDKDAMHVIDTGLGRTPGNVFEIEGIPNAGAVAAVTRLLVAYERGVLGTNREMGLITRDDLLDFYGAHAEEIQRAAVLSFRVARAIRGPKAGWGALAYILSEAQEELALEFFDALVLGASMEKGDARLAFRNYAIQRSSDRTFRTTHQIAQGIKAWNEWITGARRDHFKPWIPGKPIPEPIKP